MSFDVLGPVLAVLVIFAALIVVPAFLGSRNTEYVYGASGFVEPGSQLYEDTELIERDFQRFWSVRGARSRRPVGQREGAGRCARYVAARELDHVIRDHGLGTHPYRYGASCKP